MVLSALTVSQQPAHEELTVSSRRVVLAVGVASGAASGVAGGAVVRRQAASQPGCPATALVARG
jgi:hypothetical protein